MQDAERKGRLADPAEPDDDGVIVRSVFVDGKGLKSFLYEFLAAKDDGTRWRWIERCAANTSVNAGGGGDGGRGDSLFARRGTNCSSQEFIYSLRNLLDVASGGIGNEAETLDAVGLRRRKEGQNPFQRCERGRKDRVVQVQIVQCIREGFEVAEELVVAETETNFPALRKRQ
jgi:hypothetical protein